MQIKDIDPLLVKKERFGGSLTDVYKVEKEGSLYVLKVGEEKWKRSHLIYERKALLAAREIEGVTHLVNTYWITNTSFFRKDIALLKEYFDGSSLWKLKRIDCLADKIKDNNKLQVRLEKTVRELHAIGIADLDWRSRNIVVSPDQQEIKIIDLGLCSYFRIFRGSRFEECKSRDLSRLERLLKYL